jgi:hemoglobin/transferrin/lactoferrin receptor protein
MDGIRQADSFTIGGYSSAGRNMVDVGMLSGVDIQRGAGSALQGSEGIGGVVSFRSPEPEDFLRGRSFAVSPEAIYQGVDRSLGLIGTLAVGNDLVKLMLRGVQRRGQEFANKGDVGGFGFERTKPNPQDVNTLNGLAKLVFTPFPGYRATLAAEGFERVIDTDYMSFPRGGGTGRIAVDATDTYRRGRFSLDQRLSGSRLGTIDLKFYRQVSRTGQLFFDEGRQMYRGSLKKTLTEREFFFEQILTGTRLQTESIFELLGAHTLIWGAEAFRTDTRQMRDGMFLLSDGSITKEVGPDIMPTRDLPPSSTTQVALFFQDNWLLMDRLTLVTGLRYDNYHLDPKPDGLFIDRNPGVASSGVRFDAFSPKASLIFDAGWGFSFVAQYSQGFRPPPYNNVNIGFTNVGLGYVAIPNPDLKPEIVRGVELSVRHHTDRGYAMFTAYDNRYEDFINPFITLDCPANPLCVSNPQYVPNRPNQNVGPYLTTFQAGNLPRVRIYGFEGRLDQRLPWGFRLRGSFAWTKGRDLDSGLPIIQVNPPTGVLGLAYEHGPFRIEGLVTAAMRKTLKESRGVTRMIQPPAYSVVDLLAQWRFSPNGRLNVGIFNLFDKKYWHWADVPVQDVHVAETQGGPDRYTRPGRSFSISISHRF